MTKFLLKNIILRKKVKKHKNFKKFFRNKLLDKQKNSPVGKQERYYLQGCKLFLKILKYIL